MDREKMVYCFTQDVRKVFSKEVTSVPRPERREK